MGGVCLHTQADVKGFAPNLRGALTTQTYVEQFGLVARGRNEYGNECSRGMMRQYQNYPHQHRFRGQRVWIGWFMLPPVPGQMQARMRPTREELLAPQWFPAFFAGHEGDDNLQMSCLHVLVIGCKPWWVHRQRAANLIEVTEFM